MLPGAGPALLQAGNSGRNPKKGSGAASDEPEDAGTETLAAGEQAEIEEGSL